MRLLGADWNGTATLQKHIRCISIGTCSPFESRRIPGNEIFKYKKPICHSRSTYEMKTKMITIGIITLLSFLMLAGFASADPEITLTAPSPSDGATGVTKSTAVPVSVLVSSINGSNMSVRFWTSASGAVVWSDYEVITQNTTMNWTINANTYGKTVSWGVSANNSYENFTNATYTFKTALSSESTGDSGIIAKIVIGLTSIFIALGLIYWIATNYLSKKKRTIEDMVELIKVIAIVMVFLTIIVSLVVVF